MKKTGFMPHKNLSHYMIGSYQNMLSQATRYLIPMSDRRVALYHVTKMDLITLVLRKTHIIMNGQENGLKNIKARLRYLT